MKVLQFDLEMVEELISEEFLKTVRQHSQEMLNFQHKTELCLWRQQSRMKYLKCLYLKFFKQLTNQNCKIFNKGTSIRDVARVVQMVPDTSLH